MRYPALSLGAWLRHDFILALVDGSDPSSIIEFGPGLGALGARLADRADYEAVEPDADSRQAARALLGSRVKASLDEVGFEQADMVCAFEVLEHLADDAGSLKEWITRLAPGGLVVVSVPAFMDQFGPHDEIAGHLRRYTPDDIDALFRTCGLEPVEIRLTGFPLGFALQWGRNQLAGRRRVHSTSVEERTGASGRLYQFESNGWLTQILSWPFRKLQLLPTGRGTGLVAAARKP
ncbi:MAG: class I SAM-dependent methyltransferase [Acidimicrobiales bacterium]